MSSDPLCLGLAGGTGSGKTTVAREIVRAVGEDRIAVLTQDSYYRDLRDVPHEAWLHHNFDHPEALETGLMVEHVRELKAGRSVEVPEYDFARHLRRGTRTVSPRRVILVEGILVLAESGLRDLMDVKLYVDTDADLRFIRRLSRDVAERGRTVESVVTQYVETVRPMHLEFVEPSKRWADVVIPRGGHNTVALEMVISRVERMLAAD